MNNFSFTSISYKYTVCQIIRATKIKRSDFYEKY